jgi:hypothetical protein
VSLRERAAADLRGFLTDASGFAWPVTVTAPDGQCISTHGFSTDIGDTIDPETGQAVAGRAASVALSIPELEEACGATPRAIAATDMKPWRVTFNDIMGKPHTYKVQESMPDLALGIVTCRLEAYRS